ncbi:hypothetical protein GXP67_28280 [Rhodocytophaga rosea]|uniref:Uncharacterized protein n=1 Tax=Rhodocytophaga rosea TaxID=2704465 RepID=A0A6C0GQD7_9BACT|nr:hypothetical protein [Rhodocytophaga rosea]QHT70271.1 hypothetical protein GXP67_28280 [Rhodocytophaga rosea]
MKEKNIPILHKTIAQLSIYQAPDAVWQKVEEGLEKSEEYSFPEAATLDVHLAKVQANLKDLAHTQQKILSQAISALPQHQVKKDVFDQLIDSVEGKKEESRNIWYWTSGIAASLLLLIGFFWVQQSSGNEEQIQITYSQEVLTPLDYRQAAETTDTTDEVLDFIRQHCVQVAEKCQEPQFKGLYEEYLQLQEAKSELETQLHLHQNQPDLVRYLIRVEKQQTEVGKKLIQQLFS